MKVGTDGVLLGAWASLEGGGRVLDVGTGTGVIALMAAQRSPKARIDAVELDEQAARQALENAANSPWAGQIRVHHTTIQDFARENPVRYEHILCNPPFFVRSLKAPDAARAAARHSDVLPFDELAAAVERLLAENGIFSVVYPATEAADFQRIMLARNLYATRRMQVRGTPRGPVKRVLLEFSRRPSPVVEEELTIERAPKEFTEEYRRLTADFYLKF